MLGGSNHNSLVPVFLDENLFQYPSNQLQLFGNLPATHNNVDPVNYSGREQHNSPAFRSNKRSRETETNLIMQKKLQITLNQNNFYNEESSINPKPHTVVSTGLKLSYDDEERNSSITSASGSMTGAPPPLMSSCFGDSVTTELDRHNEELERYIMLQGENMLKGVKEIRQRHMASFLGSISKGIDKKMREKDLEIETINRKNKELIERIKQLANEAQNWHYRAKYNESIANMLRANLEQALAAQGNDQHIKEGFGDNTTDDVENDAVSSIDPNNYLAKFHNNNNNNDNKNVMICRACKVKEVSVVVMPCRHLSLCQDCDGRGVNVCPVCQMVKTVGVQVYMS